MENCFRRSGYFAAFYDNTIYNQYSRHSNSKRLLKIRVRVHNFTDTSNIFIFRNCVMRNLATAYQKIQNGAAAILDSCK
jgi:hypothetical protein